MGEIRRAKLWALRLSALQKAGGGPSCLPILEARQTGGGRGFAFGLGRFLRGAQLRGRFGALAAGLRNLAFCFLRRAPPRQGAFRVFKAEIL